MSPFFRLENGYNDLSVFACDWRKERLLHGTLSWLDYDPNGFRLIYRPFSSLIMEVLVSMVLRDLIILDPVYICKVASILEDIVT